MKRNSVLLFLLFISIDFFGQAPDWSVNASNFQYNMTITAFINLDGTTLTNPNDKLGAFVNDENRGEATVVFNANANKYLVYLTVYANVNGETVHFKIYDSTKNQIVSTNKTVIFSINANFGGVFQSESFANPELSKNANFSSFGFKNINEVSTVISNNEILIELPKNTIVNNLIPEYTTSNNAKVFINQKAQISGEEITDFTNDIVYQVLSEDESVLKTYTVKVTVISDSGNNIPAVLSSVIEFSKDKLVTVNLSFSKEVTGLESHDFAVSNAFIKAINTQNNKDFNIELVALNQGEISIQLQENTVLDSENNSNNTSNIIKVNFDHQSPILKEVIVQETNFLITFSEDVQNVSISNFALAGLAKDGFEIVEIVKISNSNYLLKMNDLQTHIGNVYPIILPLSIQDSAGNLLETQIFEEYVKTKTLATNGYFEEDELLVYPNPSSEQIYLKLLNRSIKSIKIYNLLGQVIENIPVSNEQELKINTNNLSKNSYLLEVLTTDNKRFVKKIIKN